MNVLEYNNIIDKLGVQVKSFQEGFEILCNSASLEELGSNFCHILRTNFFITDVNIFFRSHETEAWKPIKIHNEKSLESLLKLRTNGATTVEYFTDSEFAIIVILPLIDGSSWGIVLGNKMNKTEISELDKITLQMFLQLLDNSYQSFVNQQKEKQLNFSLNNRVVQLNSLIDTGIEISKLQKTSSLFELSLERAASLTNAARGVLQIISEDKILSSIGFPGDIDISKVLESDKSISTVVEFGGVKYLFTLSEKESRKGIIDFDKTDENLLKAFAQQVLAAMENEHLHNEAIDKERMYKEIETAAEIQKKIIPQQLPEIEGYDLAGINIPSLEIGGDYYDVKKLKNGRYLIIIADVAGKGIASGLLVNTLNASLNAYLENGFKLVDVADRLNKIIYDASTSDKYITGFIAILDPKTGKIEYLNAGHNPIFFTSKGKLIKLDKGGCAFGMLDLGLPYESDFIQLDKGEKFLFYTDGISEAMNENEEEYSDERLEMFFLNNNPTLAKAFIDDLMTDIQIHTADTPQSDDITALYLIRN